MVVFWRGYGYIGLLAGLLPVGTNFTRSQPTALPFGLAMAFSRGCPQGLAHRAKLRCLIPQANHPIPFTSSRTIVWERPNSTPHC